MDAIDLALRKSEAARKIADALCFAATGQRLAQLPRTEPAYRYHELAEAIVQVACDERADIAAEYYACDCSCASRNVSFSSLTPRDRVRMVQDFHHALCGWLRVVRGDFRNLTPYRVLAESDRDGSKVAVMPQVRDLMGMFV